MASMVNDTRAMGTSTTLKQTELSEGMRFTRYCALEEMVGLVFGVMTVAYILMSLAGLA